MALAQVIIDSQQPVTRRDIKSELWVENPVHNKRIGREGAIYLTPDRKFAVKIFHPQNQQPHLMVMRRNHILRSILNFERKGGSLSRSCAVPLALVSSFNGHPCVGVVMEFIDGEELMALIENPIVARTCLVSDPNSNRHLDWSNYLEIAIELAGIIAALHDGAGVVHGDLQYRNVLISRPREGGTAVHLLECESVVVAGILGAWVRGLFPFMAPEMFLPHPQPTIYTDYHSLAVLIYHNLLFRNPFGPHRWVGPDDQDADGNNEEFLRRTYSDDALFSEHPNDARNRPPNLGEPFFADLTHPLPTGTLSYQMLPPAFRERCHEAFITGLRQPVRRPTPETWRDTLMNIRDCLVRCPHCHITNPYPYWRGDNQRPCAFCGHSFGPCLTLFLRESDGRGIYHPLDRCVVLPVGGRIYLDTALPRSRPFSPQQRIALATKSVLGSVFGGMQSLALRNETNLPWRVLGANPRVLRPGEGDVLRKGDIVQFPAVVEVNGQYQLHPHDSLSVRLRSVEVIEAPGGNN